MPNESEIHTQRFLALDLDILIPKSVGGRARMASDDLRGAVAPSELGVRSRSKPWFWPCLLSVTVVGLIVRILFVSLAHFARVANDAMFFRTTAHNLVSGNGYTYPFPSNPSKFVPTAAHPPLFSLVLAAFDLLGLQSVQAQRLALAVVSSAAILLMGLAGRRLLSPSVGVVAAAVAAVHPLWLQTVGSLMSESVYLAVIPAVLLTALRALDRPSGWRLITLGATIGAAALVRSEGILLVLLVALPVVLMGTREWRSRSRLFGAALLGCVLLVAPWLIRNEIQLGTATLSTQGGLTLIGSYCPSTFNPNSPTFGAFDGVCADGTAAFFIQNFNPPAGDAQWNEVEIDHRLTHTAEDFARHHLGQLPRIAAAREVSTWALTGQGFQLATAVEGGRNATFEKLGGAFYWILTPFVLAGICVLGARSWRRLLVLLGPVIVVVMIVAVTYGDTRFRVLAEPSLALLAAVGLVTTMQWIRHQALRSGNLQSPAGAPDGPAGAAALLDQPEPHPEPG
jgi:4-amino-4-deoxy-L-arabinose transferase-like glycosyltransferase